MADFIHQREHLSEGDVVVVDCSHQSNIMIMDDMNFNHYRRGQKFRHWGGHYARFPARITVPHTDDWNVVIDLGGGRANIRYNIGFIR